MEGAGVEPNLALHTASVTYPHTHTHAHTHTLTPPHTRYNQARTLERMEGAGVEPNLAIHTVFVAAAARQANPQRVEQVRTYGGMGGGWGGGGGGP